MNKIGTEIGGADKKSIFQQSLDELSIEKVKADIISVGEFPPEILAIGIFGSLARNEGFTERSDIDIFIVVSNSVYEKGMKYVHEFQFEWYSKFHKLFYNKYHRNTTVLLYPYNGIRYVTCWQTISLASDSILVYDRDELICRMFKRIVEKAIAAGLERYKYTRQYVWRIKPKLIKQGKKVVEVTLENDSDFPEDM